MVSGREYKLGPMTRQSHNLLLEGVLSHPVDRSADGNLMVSGKRAQLCGEFREAGLRKCLKSETSPGGFEPPLPP
jgi:hypothetical protein